MVEEQDQSSESEYNVRDEEKFVPLLTNGLDREGKHKAHGDGSKDTRPPVHFLEHQCNSVSLDPCPSCRMSDTLESGDDSNPSVKDVHRRERPSSDPKDNIIPTRQAPEDRKVVEGHDGCSIGNVPCHLKTVRSWPVQVFSEEVIPGKAEDDVECNVGEHKETLKPGRDTEPVIRMHMLVTKECRDAEVLLVVHTDLSKKTV